MKRWSQMVVLGVGMLLLVFLACLRSADAEGAEGVTSPSSPARLLNGGYNLGAHSVRTTFSSESCGFAPFSSAALLLDGKPGGAETTDGNGCATATITISSASQSRIAQTGIPVATTCGSGSLVAAGHNPASVPVGQAVSFGVVCPARGAPIFTGVQFVRWLLAALVLLAAAFTLIIANDRRRLRLKPQHISANGHAS